MAARPQWQRPRWHTRAPDIRRRRPWEHSPSALRAYHSAVETPNSTVKFQRSPSSLTPKSASTLLRSMPRAGRSPHDAPGGVRLPQSKASRQMEPVFLEALESGSSRRAHQLRRRHATHGDADQLLRPAGGRLGVRNRRRQARHLRRADGGGGNHAPRRRRGLRFLRDPAARRAGARHAEQRQRPGVLHARVRPELRNRGIGRCPPRRADGHPALRPSRYRAFHPRQGRRRATSHQCHRQTASCAR